MLVTVEWWHFRQRHLELYTGIKHDNIHNLLSLKLKEKRPGFWAWVVANTRHCNLHTYWQEFGICPPPTPPAALAPSHRSPKSLNKKWVPNERSYLCWYKTPRTQELGRRQRRTPGVDQSIIIQFSYDLLRTERGSSKYSIKKHEYSLTFFSRTKSITFNIP